MNKRLGQILMKEFRCYGCYKREQFKDEAEARRKGWKDIDGDWYCSFCEPDEDDSSSYSDDDEDDSFGIGFGGSPGGSGFGFGGGSFGGGGGKW